MTNPVSMRTENRLIVADYIYYRLHKKGLQWPNCPLQPSPGGTPPDPPSQSVERVLRSMGNEFEERYTQVFQNMCSQLDITPQNIRNTFLCTANELYTGQEIKWGRIVALFAFAGCLAADCVAKGMPDQVDQVLELTTDYINHNLMSWISQNGHWVSKCSPFKSLNYQELS